MLSSVSTPLSTSLTIRSTVNTNKAAPQIQQERLSNCAAFAGQPLTRQQARDKLDRCPVFRQTVSEYKSSSSSDSMMDKAIQVDYGMRLRSCLYARPAAKAHHNGHLPY